MAIKKYHVSKNLFDISFNRDTDYSTTVYKWTLSGLTPNTSYTCSTNFVQEGSSASIWFGGVDSIGSGVSVNNPKTKTSNSSGKIPIYIRHGRSTDAYELIDSGDVWLMVNEGSTVLPYEPYSSEVWNTIPYRKYGTETDTLTSLPADVIADGQSASANIIGNMNQQGTPSPSSIIMPSECGNKTANLLYSPSTGTTTAPLVVSYTTNSAEFTLNKDTTSSNVSAAVLCNIVLDAGTYSVKVQGLNSAGVNLDRIYLVDSNNSIVINNVINNTAAQFTLTEETTIAKIAFVVAAASTYNNQSVKIMLNSGGTSLPYEPFGIKIPISSGGVTTNWYTSEPLRKLTYIYSGKPETALDAKSNTTENRNICKLELTGQEDWGISGGVFWLGTLTTDYMRKYNSANYICSHYPCYQQTGSAGNVPDMQIAMGYNSAVQRIYLHDSNYTTVQDFQAYLAQQYAAGTPVTLWYVMATGTTVQVAAPSIPTTGTAEQFDVNTTLKPSEVDLTYHGWHEHQDTKFTG